MIAKNLAEYERALDDESERLITSLTQSISHIIRLSLEIERLRQQNADYLSALKAEKNRP